MKNQIEIKFKVTYVKSNLSPKESHPTLYCYLDANFNRKKHKVLLGQEGDQHEVVVTGVGKPTQTSSLCFATLSWRKNASTTRKSPCS